MTIVLGSASSVSWGTARDKVRGDLWRPGANGIPDDVVNRAIHASLQELESERRWLWLENLTGVLAVAAGVDYVDLPATVQSVSQLAIRIGNAYDILTPLSLGGVRELSQNSSGWPARYALADGRIYFDTRLAQIGQLELIFTAQTPDELADAVDTANIALDRNQQAIIALACSYVALSYLKNDAEAARQRQAYEGHLRRLEQKEDQQRGDLSGGGGIRPDTDYHDAAFGRC